MAEIANEEDQKLRDALNLAESIIDTIREPLIVLNGELKVIQASGSFYRFFKVKREETEKHFIYDLGNRQWDIPKLRKLLEDILPKNTTFDNFEVEHEFPTIGKRTLLLNARRIPPPPEKIRTILLAVEDITERRRVEEELRKYHKHLEEMVTSRTFQFKEKVDELESFNKMAVDRELKMIELKKDINALLNELGRDNKY